MDEPPLQEDVLLNGHSECIVAHPFRFRRQSLHHMSVRTNRRIRQHPVHSMVQSISSSQDENTKNGEGVAVPFFHSITLVTARLKGMVFRSTGQWIIAVYLTLPSFGLSRCFLSGFLFNMVRLPYTNNKIYLFIFIRCVVQATSFNFIGINTFGNWFQFTYRNFRQFIFRFFRLFVVLFCHNYTPLCDCCISD